MCEKLGMVPGIWLPLANGSCQENHCVSNGRGVKGSPLSPRSWGAPRAAHPQPWFPAQEVPHAWAPSPPGSVQSLASPSAAEPVL